MHVGVLGQEIADPLRLMSGEVVEDDVNLSPLLHGDELTQERNELLGRMARRGLAEDDSGTGIEGREEREGDRSIAWASKALRRDTVTS
jgi:hypothetical protein